MRILLKKRATRSSPFSVFIRTASAAEKKRVYGQVLVKATARQVRVLDARDAKIKGVRVIDQKHDQ